MSGLEDDDVLLALRNLGAEEPHPARSRAVVAGAVTTIARRRRFAERRLVAMGGFYGAMIAPFAAGSLSAGYLAAAIVQAVVVLQYAHGRVFWP